jgi:hypothetical protein
MTFEHDEMKRLRTIKFKFIDIFNYAMILEAISAGSTNSAFCGFSMGPSSLSFLCESDIHSHHNLNKLLASDIATCSKLSQFFTTTFTCDHKTSRQVS